MAINIDLWFMVALILIFFVVGMLIGIGMCMTISSSSRGERLSSRHYR